jgi:hypothetical protein
MLELKTVTNGPNAMQLQCACHDTLPGLISLQWLISFSSERTPRRSEADDFAIEPALQFLREAFEVNQLAVEPVHRQITAQLLDAFAQFDGKLLSR